MTDSNVSPIQDGEDINVVIRQMTKELEQRLRDGEALMVGEVNVELLMNVGEVTTPVEAVARAMSIISRFGMDGLTFRVVEKETENYWLVRAGHLVDEETLDQEYEQYLADRLAAHEAREGGESTEEDGANTE